MFALPIFTLRFKSINVIKISLKLSHFCTKTPNFLVLGALPPNPSAFSAWGLYPLTPSQRRLRVSRPPPKTSPIANFWLRTWSFNCCYVILSELILRLAGVYRFPQAALSLNKFAHPWFRPYCKCDENTHYVIAPYSNFELNDSSWNIWQCNRTLRFWAAPNPNFWLCLCSDPCNDKPITHFGTLLCF